MLLFVFPIFYFRQNGLSIVEVTLKVPGLMVGVNDASLEARASFRSLSVVLPSYSASILFYFFYLFSFAL